MKRHCGAAEVASSSQDASRFIVQLGDANTFNLQPSDADDKSKHDKNYEHASCKQRSLYIHRPADEATSTDIDTPPVHREVSCLALPSGVSMGER